MTVVGDLLGARTVARVRQAFRLRDAFRDQLLALSYGMGRILAHDEKRWKSPRFAGSRHSVLVEYQGADEVNAGEDMLARMSVEAFCFEGQRVVQAHVVDVEHRLLPEPRLRATLEILFLEEDA